MSGILSVFAGSSPGTQVIVGAIVSQGNYYYGYDNSNFDPASFGSIVSGVYKGVQILGIWSRGEVAGQADEYAITFAGTQADGFFSTLTIGGTLLQISGSWNRNTGGGNTQFSASALTKTTTLFGTTLNAAVSVLIA